MRRQKTMFQIDNHPICFLFAMEAALILYIYCGGGLGAEVLFAASRQNRITGKYSEIAFIDDTFDNKPILNTRSCSYQSIQSVQRRDECEIVIANGEPFFRESLFLKVTSDGFSLATVIDPMAAISDDAAIRPGVVAFSGACVSPFARIEQNVLLYYNVVVSHHSCVGESSLLSSGSVISGHCTLGNRVFVGAAASVREKVRVGDDCILGMGSVILNDVESNTVMCGSPGRILRRNINRMVFRPN